MATARRLLAVTAGIALAACVQNNGSRNPLSDFGKVSVQDERRLGFEVDQKLQENLVLIEDALVLSMLNELGQSLVETLGEQPFTYRFRVLVDPSLNAFALPGGPIYFHSGTILQAGNLDELAGVMAHEIAHVKARHYARQAEAAAIPGLLAQLAGVLATVATGQAEPLLIAQGVNVALQLRYTRELEAEADNLGATFMARGGYDPQGAVRFFERVLSKQRDPGIEIPPYLYSHPAVESRIEVGIQRAEQLTITGTRPPGLERAFRATQYRLSRMLELRRNEIKEAVGTRNPDADPQ
ncbi:MAG: M48 family metalloprotease, partial [bacterium]|nr:M48 family metalloprotease [bacterium]